MTLEHIAEQAKEVSLQIDALASDLTDLERQIATIKARKMTAIKGVARKLRAEKCKLEMMINDGRHLFEKPRTHEFHGLRVGLMKGKGGLAWEDPDDVVARIHKLYGDGEDARALLNITEKPDKKALEALDVGSLKKLGVQVVESGDRVLIKAVDSDTDKLVNALLSDTTAELEEVQAAAA